VTGPAITVGIPVYNAERYLQGAIDSVLSQTTTDLELLVADNASTDSTADIIRAAARQDSRVHILPSGVNRGLSWNWNRLVAAATGQYFRWACYDDRLEPKLLEVCHTFLQGAGPDVVGCFPRTVDIDETDAVIGPYDDLINAIQDTPHERLGHLVRDLRRCNALFSLVRTDVLRSTRLFGRYAHPDHVVLAELVLRGKLAQLDEPLFLRRMHASNTLQVHRTFAQLAQLHDPELNQRRYYPHTRLFAENFRAIGGAPIDAREKILCAQALVTEWWLYRAMAGETKANVMETFTGRPGQPRD
jgi:glycosyltransferase involved in cell wall biosynthesis